VGYYKESRKINLVLTVVYAIPILACIAGMAYGYSYLTKVNPFIYINFLFTAGYVIITGAFVVFLKRLGKIRNFNILLFITLLIAVFSAYAVWVSYIAVSFESSIAFAMENFQSSIKVLSNQSFSIGRAIRSSSIEFSGWGLYILWGVEVILFIGGPFFMVFSMAKNNLVFCEDCNKWADKKVTFYKIPTNALTKENLEETVLQNKLKDLLALPDYTNNAKMYNELTIVACENCQSKHYLTVNQVVNSINEKGNKTKKEKLILPFLEIDSFTTFSKEIFENTNVQEV